MAISPDRRKSQKANMRDEDGDNAPDISDEEACTRELEKMVEVKKGAVAMEICVSGHRECTVSLYGPNGATRKARRQLSATTMMISSEQSQTRATDRSVWLGIEPYEALFNHGTARKFTFRFDHRHGQLHTFVRKLGLSIAQNANLVERLRICSRCAARCEFFQQLFSLDVWKEAFPALQGAYLILDGLYNFSHMSPHLMKHVRSLEQHPVFGAFYVTPDSLDSLRNMIRNKDSVIEEIDFPPDLLWNAKLLDDTLRRVRSFKVQCNGAAFGLLASSFERTKAEDDKLERVKFDFTTDYFSVTALERIIRSRPNLQLLNLEKISLHDFVPLCTAVASSTLTAFICDCSHLMRVEGAVDAVGIVEEPVDAVGILLQHSTIRDFRLTISGVWHGDSPCHDNFVQGVAEGLRATRLRRFHLTMFSCNGASIASMTKLYESVRENRSLMDIQLKGTFWDPWREWRHDLSHPHPPPCPFSFFEFLSSRNQYLSLLLMPYEYTLPAGLWPLILESASGDASILYYLLTLQPHLVKGKVEGTVVADREWDVDVPARQCRRIA